MQNPNVKIKVVIFGIRSDSLVVFTPNAALPTQTIVNKISLEKQVDDIFFNTMGLRLNDNYVEQLYTITNEKNEITIVYYVLLNLNKNLSGFMSISDIKKTNNDKEIIAYAVQRLQWKIEYTNVVYSLLPKEFTLSELQKTYEAILGQILDKRNFRKKILSLKFLEPTKKRKFGVSRPAQMYTFKNRTPVIVKIFS